jgi:type IV pilus assembly protein PilQ
VDLKDFFRLIHEISGLNVVLDPNVRGTVTLVLDDVPWDQALDIVLRNNQLDKQIEGNVLRIATRATVKQEAEAQRDLAKAQAEAVDQITTTRTLSYAKAAGMRDTLKRFLSSRGEILSDDRSNTLIIRDIPSVIPDLDNLIKQLDRRGQQVEIEARVVAASRDFSREIGTQFGFATTSTGGRTVFGGLVGNTAFNSPIERGSGLPTPPLVASGTNSIPLNTNLGAVAPTSGASFAHASPNLALDFIISAAESKGVGKLLSKPKVITQNNEKAMVKQGTKIPVQTVINNTITVQFVDAVLKLEVTPQISADGTIYMDVVVENTAIDTGTPRVGGIPALTTQSAETKVLINDGGTVVIGGVIISTQATDIRQVPLFGSIPIIGHLFKHTTTRTKSQELLFFITPRIVPS